MMEEDHSEDETKTQEGDPRSGLDRKQLERMAHEGNGNHVHKLIDGSFTSAEIDIETGGHVHTYKSEHGDDKRTSIAEDHEGHTHDTNKGTTGLPE